MPIQIDRMSLADVPPNAKELAAAVLKQLGEPMFPTPIEEIAIGCGITDIKQLTINGFEGALLTSKNKNDGVILVKKHNIPTRRRFTVGHELGHFLNPWHEPPPEGFMCTTEQMLYSDRKETKDRQQMEAQANEFAAEVLMPPELFMKQFRRAGGDLTTKIVAKVADDFEVSKLATARRLVDLRKDCAAILSHDGVIEQIYRGDEFPFITLMRGQQIPRGSITKKQQGEPGTHSEIEETETATWTIKETKRGLQFLEQVLIQSNGYRLSLLTLDESECEDEEDEWVREQSEWNPTLHKSRRK